MAQQGGRSEWERRQAAARREADRQAREHARLAKEREKEARERHLQGQQRKAEERSAAVAARSAELDGILASALRQAPFSLRSLEVVASVPAFEPGTLAVAGTSPAWEDYAPAAPGAISRLFGGSTRHEHEVATARTRWEADVAMFKSSEAARQRALAEAETEHARRVELSRMQAAAHNATIAQRRKATAAGEPEAVEWFVDQVLKAFGFPSRFPTRWQVAYRPENRDVVVELELPAQDLVPAVREYRYIKARDEINPVALPAGEVRKRYARLVACVTLRTLHEIFAATPVDVVEAVVFNGRVSAVDRATGQDIRPHLVSVQAEREAFAGLDLTRVDPAACLKHLNALVSPNPADLEEVEPFIEFDLKRFRFVDSLDELAGLDSRRNLLELSPTEFEHLVKDLFVAMGAQAWRTVPSKDGGVDAVATSKNLFFGGVCLIQAKRWTGLVGLDAVHALTGVMTDHNATTGVLVTTSWFSRTSEQFAQRNRITLINGAELKHLIKEHLGYDVLPGTNPPRRLRASDNTQTGKPGPSAR